MTPQSHFTVVAPLAPGREHGLRVLLGSMNAKPGLADPHNAVLPFGDFDWLHFARLVLFDDELQADLEAHGVARPRLPTCLALLGDCDGPAERCLADLAHRGGDGLRRIFAHCDGFAADGDLLEWMLAHCRPAAAAYVNWVGRSVRQIRQESALQKALSARLPRGAIDTPAAAQRLRAELIDFAETEIAAGRLVLDPPAPTPPGWRARQLAHAIGVPLLGLALLPPLLLASPLLLALLRWRERTDPELCPRPSAELLQSLEELEDHDVTNQYSAIGPVKPGLFRRWLVSALLVAIDYACRHVFTRGHLARVQTIHFARWVFLDDRTRVAFASNYDGSHQGYMDDFINKVAWGLNLVFSNGVGWPRTRWLIFGGARLEQRFKRYQRRHQIPTQVWYKAYPALTLLDLRRNQQIRDGLLRRPLGDAQAIEWLRLL